MGSDKIRISHAYNTASIVFESNRPVELFSTHGFWLLIIMRVTLQEYDLYSLEPYIKLRPIYTGIFWQRIVGGEVGLILFVATSGFFF